MKASKVLGTLFLSSTLVLGLTAHAELNEPVNHEMLETFHQEEHLQGEEIHVASFEVMNSGSQLLAEGTIEVYILGGNKQADVRVLKQDEVELIAVDVESEHDGFNCYTSTDGVGSNGLYASVNEYGKIQEIKRVTVYYRHKEQQSIQLPDCNHTSELVETIKVPPLEEQNGANVLHANGSIEVEFNGDGYANIYALGKETNIRFVHGEECYQTSGMGVIKIPIERISEFTVYVNTPGDRLPILESQPKDPDKPKLEAVLLPNTGLGIATTTVLVGLGLIGTGVVISKKRKDKEDK